MSPDDLSLALANPLSALLDKPPGDFVRADFLDVIRKKGIERIAFHYTALDGRLKEIKIPVTSLSQAELALAEGERVDGSSVFKGIVDTELSDLYVIPEYRTAFFNPFDDKSLGFICRLMTREGERASFAFDNVLTKAAQIFRESSGFDLFAAGELEFFLIFPKEKELFPVERQMGYQESSPFIKSIMILDEMVRSIAKISGAVKYSHSEVGYIDQIESELEELQGKTAEQLEVEFLSRPAEEMADFLVLARWLIRNVAHRHGCMVTFAPKIEEGVAGNGLHFHLELRSNGRNIMLDSQRNLSEQARRLIGGVCTYADSLTAFGNTTASSYMRLIPNHEAPTRIFWSDLNRSALIRVPLGWASVSGLADKINPESQSEGFESEPRQTVELRSADGSALIHLLLAGVAVSAKWAFEDNRSLEAAERYYVKDDKPGSSSALVDLPSLPASCTESAEILEEKRRLYEMNGVFPASLIDYVVELLQKEDVGIAGQDRQQSIKSIMHRDLHRH